MKYVRVLKFASNPSARELKMVGGVAGAGITLIGLLGYLMYLIMSVLPL